ncbi:DNA-binding domain-containing protein [Catalinimonas niigatensis]|uniref:DNA-binding domain-containing protein n=1 Tax=Catalinimonas niigatensis TaxID=1397264 RepID=UPI0026661BDA|nr:DNA-binding domain-containing protein [Catalinimonas niigatensis]WPP49969.1 DNA-binding domain-containing protein [Catalinimonas niigatensis]
MAALYALVDNPLTPDPTDFRASVQHGKAVTEEELMEMIVLRNTGISISVAKKVIFEYGQALRHYMEKGRSVNGALLNSQFSISGVFTSEEDVFDANRHALHLNFTPGTLLKDVVEHVAVKKVEAMAGLPLISSYFDTESSSKNDVLTPNELGRIVGKRMKFDENDPAQGLFFVNDKKKDFAVVKFGECMPGKIIFKVPQMASGIYTLEIRCGADKIGKLKGSLTVA